MRQGSFKTYYYMIYKWKHSWRISIVLFWFTETAGITSVMFFWRCYQETWFLLGWVVGRGYWRYPILPMCDNRHYQHNLRHCEIFWWDCKLCQGKGIYVHGLHTPLPPHILPLSRVSSLWRIAPGHWCWGCGWCSYEHTALHWVPYLENELRRWRYAWKKMYVILQSV